MSIIDGKAFGQFSSSKTQRPDNLEPDIMYKIEHTCIFLNQLHVTFEDDIAEFQKANIGLRKLRHLSRDLSTYRNSTHSFTKLDELEAFDIIYD